MKKNYKTPSTNTRKIRTTILCGSGDPTPTPSAGSNESVGQGQSFGARERNSGSSLSF